jgi:sugar lactone lactonase YvrE
VKAGNGMAGDRPKDVVEVEAHGLLFPEGPRWRDGTWWVSDQLGDRVVRVDEQGSTRQVAELGAPSGLGFATDGTLLVARMHEPSVVAVDSDGCREVADLRRSARHLNDMVVDSDGRAYVDAYDDPFDVATHRLLRIDPDGLVADAAHGLSFPNGLAVTERRTLLVAETFAGRITEFDIGDDGSLSGPRTWAQLPEGRAPDGLCLDANGDLWVAAYTSGEFFHLQQGGKVLDHVQFPDRWAMSCALGGADGRTLLLCTAATSQDDYFAGRSVGHLDLHRVDVPGVGRP